MARLLRAHETQEEGSFSDRELRDAVVTLLLAGHETTANALATALYLIFSSPTTEERVATEAQQTASSYPDCELPEAHKAFQEAIRIYPSIWILERRVVVEDSIGGYRIPKRSTVLLSPYLLHRHPEFWEAPHLYDPQRFTVDRIADRTRYAYIPFGLGPHRCIGEPMALLSATRIVSGVAGRFRLRPLANQTIRRFPGITLRYDTPVWMTVHRTDRNVSTELVGRNR